MICFELTAPRLLRSIPDVVTITVKIKKDKNCSQIGSPLEESCNGDSDYDPLILEEGKIRSSICFKFSIDVILINNISRLGMEYFILTDHWCHQNMQRLNCTD